MKKLKSLLITAMLLLAVCPLKSRADIPATPQTASTDAAKKLYGYFVEQYGQKCISSVMADVNWNNTIADKVNTLTGKYPAMNCYDFIHIYVPNQDSNGWINYNDITPVQTWHEAGGIVQLMWHFNVPKTETTEIKTDGSGVTCSPGETTFKAANALVGGTWENKWFYEQMDRVIAVVLKLQEAGIAATWRPFHEGAGNATLKSGASWGKAWFWWGYDGADTYKKLWTAMFDYFKQKGVQNLIWIWTTQNYNGDSNSYNQDTDWYPGNQYCDIVARDLYGCDADQNLQEFTEIQARYPNKMVVLGECGKGNSGEQGMISDCWTKGAKWGHFMVWYQGGQGSTDTMCSDAWWCNAMGNPNVITRDQLPNLVPGKVVFESATDAVKNMGVGWNLGNTLDANSQTVTDVSDSKYWGQQDLNSETCWGQYVTKPTLMQMMKDAGFGAIRVPVTWYNHMDSDGNVDAAWMARVHEVVDYVISQDMYCIINVHHDTGADGTGFTSWIKADYANYTANKDRYVKLWRQIAEEFKDYGEKLLFEGYNEMLDKISSWCFASFNATNQYDAAIATSAYNGINSYAQSFVSAVRGTGGNNLQRNLIVNTYAAACGTGNWNTHLQDPLNKLKKPTGESNHIIFEVHTYPNIANLSSAKREIDDMIKSLNTNLVTRLGGPVIIGEWGTSNVDAGAGQSDYDVRRESMLDFVNYFITKTKANNMAAFYWMGLTNGMSRLYPAFDQTDLALKMLQAYHGSSHNPKLPTLEDYSDASVSATVNYTSQWGEFTLFEGSISSADYKGIQIELEKAQGSGAVQFKVYDSGQTQAFTQAKSTLNFTAAMGTIKKITLQWCKATNGSVRIKSVKLIKKDGTTISTNISVFWGCYMSDVDIITDIQTVQRSSINVQHYYNLAGQRVDNGYKGLVIKNGRKVVLK